MNEQNPEYIKLQIDGIFILEKVAKEFNMSPSEMVDFHNAYCNIHELLPKFLPKHIDFLYLPIKKFNLKVEKLLNSSALHKPLVDDRKKYGVSVLFIPKDLKLHYTVNIGISNNKIDIGKEKSYINDAEVNQTMAQLFEKVENTLYPLEIITNENGALVTIINHEKIRKKWIEITRPKVAEFYQSAFAEQTLKQFDEIFSNLNLNIEFLQRNLFYNFFFLPIYTSYANYSKTAILEIYFSSLNKTIFYESEFQLEKEYNALGEIELNINGKELENLQNRNDKKGELNLTFILQKESHHIKSISGASTAYKKDVLHKIDFELFKLNYS